MYYFYLPICSSIDMKFRLNFFVLKVVKEKLIYLLLKMSHRYQSRDYLKYLFSDCVKQHFYNCTPIQFFEFYVLPKSCLSRCHLCYNLGPAIALPLSPDLTSLLSTSGDQVPYIPLPQLNRVAVMLMVDLLYSGQCMVSLGFTQKPKNLNLNKSDVCLKLQKDLQYTHSIGWY